MKSETSGQSPHTKKSSIFPLKGIDRPHCSLLLITILGILITIYHAYIRGYLIPDETRVMSIYSYVIDTGHWALNRHGIDISDISQKIIIPTARKQGTYAWLLALGHNIGLSPGITDFFLDAVGIILFFLGWLIIFWKQRLSIIYGVALPTLSLWALFYSPLTINLASGHTTSILCIGLVTISIASIIKLGHRLQTVRLSACGLLIGAATFLRISNLAVGFALTLYIFFSRNKDLKIRLSQTLCFAVTSIFPGLISYAWRRQTILAYGQGLTEAGWPSPSHVLPDLTRIVDTIPWPINAIGLVDSSLFADSLYRQGNRVYWTVHPGAAIFISILVLGLVLFVPRWKNAASTHKALYAIAVWVTLVLTVELSLLAVVYTPAFIPNRIEAWTPLLELRYLDIPLSFILPLILLNIELLFRNIAPKSIRKFSWITCITSLVICFTAIQPQTITLINDFSDLLRPLPNAELRLKEMETLGQNFFGEQLFNKTMPIFILKPSLINSDLWQAQARASREVLAPLEIHTHTIRVTDENNLQKAMDVCSSSPQDFAVIVSLPDHKDWPNSVNLWIDRNAINNVFESESYATFMFSLNRNECIAFP
ncbi:MAG: hypothetical protein AAGF93_11755 [Cyanobacteria bacterium P01_H01_bin.105]